MNKMSWKYLAGPERKLSQDTRLISKGLMSQFVRILCFERWKMYVETIIAIN